MKSNDSLAPLSPQKKPSASRRFPSRFRPSRHTVLILGGIVILFSIALLIVVKEGLHQDYVVTQAASCIPDSRLVNPCRPWYGAAVGKYPQVATDVKSQLLYHEQRIGRQVDIVHTYHPVGSNKLSSDDVYFATRSNTMLFTNWKPASSWASANGSNATVNASIDQMANSIKALGSTKIFLTVHHEPENDVTGGGVGCSNITYKGTYGTPTDYRAMWQNVRNRFNALGVNNVVWVMDYMNYNPWDCLVDDLYPGNSLVDWVMFNAYGGGSSPNFSSNTDHFYNLLTATNDASHDYLSKPWGIVEWNIRGATPAQEYSYYDQAKTSVETNQFPRLKAYMVFDDIGPDGNENRVAYDDNGVYDATKMAHYKSFADSSTFTTATVTNPPPPTPDTSSPAVSVTAPSNNATVSNSMAIAASASDNVGVAKVTFAIDGKAIGTDTAAPYSMTWDTNQVANGNHSLTATAYDAAGNNRTSQITITVNNTAPAGQTPATTNGQAGAAPVIKATSGQTVTDGLADDTVQSGQLVTFDPSNVSDAAKVKDISRVEYYQGSKLLQAVTAPPFALNTTNVRPGHYQITERTYYKDGSVSAKTHDLTITAQLTASKSRPQSVVWWVGGGVMVLVAVVGRIMGRRILKRRSSSLPSWQTDSDIHPDIVSRRPENDKPVNHPPIS